MRFVSAVQFFISSQFCTPKENDKRIKLTEITFFCSRMTEVHFFSSKPVYFLSTSPGMSASLLKFSSASLYPLLSMYSAIALFSSSLCRCDSTIFMLAKSCDAGKGDSLLKDLTQILWIV